VQVIGSREGGASTSPVYIPLPAALTNPSDYVLLNVIQVMQTMVKGSPELKGIDLSQLADQSHAFLDAASEA
jgi:hypothetical protein